MTTSLTDLLIDILPPEVSTIVNKAAREAFSRVAESRQAKRVSTDSRSHAMTKQVYKITYPTGKIYIGKDSIGSYRYFGSPDIGTVNADFLSLPEENRRDYTVRKQILWESDVATEEELSMMEIKLIREHRSNDPKIGYNRFPPLKSSER